MLLMLMLILKIESFERLYVGLFVICSTGSPEDVHVLGEPGHHADAHGDAAGGVRVLGDSTEEGDRVAAGG